MAWARLVVVVVELGGLEAGVGLGPVAPAAACAP
jgi:hypothetical protein